MSVDLLKNLIKEVLLENTFYNSPDCDYPGRNQTVVFSQSEKSELDGNTHGLESHAIKHYIEFEPERVKVEMSKAKKIIQGFDNVFMINKKGNIIQRDDVAKKSINTNSLLNMFDLINDKQKNNIPRNESEKMLEPILDTLAKEYNDLANYYIANCIDIDNISNVEVIKEKLKSGDILKFKGTYKGNLFNYYIDPKNTGLLAQDAKNGKLVTLFRIDKKGADLSKVAGYFSRGIKLSNLSFAEAIGILNESVLRSVIKSIFKELHVK